MNTYKVNIGFEKILRMFRIEGWTKEEIKKLAKMIDEVGDTWVYEKALQEDL